MTGPFILRRVKTDPTVIQDLPEKNEMKVYCNLSEEQATLYESVVQNAMQAVEQAEGDGIQRKGAANPYTSGNGWMASFLGKEGEVAVRLGLAELTEFLTEHDTEHPVSYGAVMKDFVVVPEAIVAEPEQLADVLRQAHAHVDALPPK